MAEPNVSDLEVFKDALMDDCVLVQVDAIKRIPALAASINTERTREELIPCIDNCYSVLLEESLYNLVDQLEVLVPFVGGNDYVELILKFFEKLIVEEEALVRNRAIQALKNICANLEPEQCEKFCYPMVVNMMAADWLFSKCSAVCVIVMCYSKMPKEKQLQLEHFYATVVQDESPMVRRAAATSLVDLVPVIEAETLKNEIVPIFDNLSKDKQDSVRAAAVDVGVALSKKMQDYEVYDDLLPSFKILSEDESWRVRQRIACKIHEMPTSEKNRDEIANIFTKCARDSESEVRVHAAENIYNFVETLWKSYNKDQDEFEKNFAETIISDVHFLIRDPVEEVRVALSANILSLSALLRDECFNAFILPLIVDALENEDEYMSFKENMLKNLNYLPKSVNITTSLKSIKSVIRNLLEHSRMHWRARRNLLLAFMHITKNTTSNYFDENLKFFYQYLLNDPIYAIRRSAPLILPLLVKQFGTSWAINSLVPIFIPFAADHRYLFRYVTLFAIEELIKPTLNYEKNYKYLSDFKELVKESKDAAETLVRIVKLNERLAAQLADDADTEEISMSDDLNFFAEDTLENLRCEQKVQVFSVSLDEVKECYLEGVLVWLNKDFVKTVKFLMQDPISNVRIRATKTWRLLTDFGSEIKSEVLKPWVMDVMKEMSEEDLKRIEDEIERKLVKEEVNEQEDENESNSVEELEELEAEDEGCGQAAEEKNVQEEVNEEKVQEAADDESDRTADDENGQKADESSDQTSEC